MILLILINIKITRTLYDKVIIFVEKISYKYLIILSFFLIDKKCYFLYNMNVNFYNKVIILKKGQIKALCLKTLKDCSLQHSC